MELTKEQQEFVDLIASIIKDSYHTQIMALGTQLIEQGVESEELLAAILGLIKGNNVQTEE